MSLTPKPTESFLKLLIVALSLALLISLVHRPQGERSPAVLFPSASAQGTIVRPDGSFLYTTNASGDVVHVWQAVGGNLMYIKKFEIPK
jgi:hypothetical protein